MSRRALGFTLVEVLVALSIIAIALTAGIQASNTLLNNAERQRESLLAQICLENAFIDLRLKSMLSNERPPAGEVTYECEQGGGKWWVVVNVAGTANPNIVRLDGGVRRTEEADSQIMALSSVLGPP